MYKDMMNSKIDTHNKILVLLLIIVNGLFLWYWGMLSMNYRMHFDDVDFSNLMLKMSMFDYVKDMYLTRGGRFFAYGLNGVVFSIANAVGTFHFWPLVFYAIGILLTWCTVKKMIAQNSSILLFLSVVFFYNLYVLTNIDFAVFTWLCAMSYYLRAPIACLMLVYCNQPKLAWWQWPIFIVLVFFIGGGNETFTPMVLLLMLFNGLYYLKQDCWILTATLHKPQVQRLVYVAIALVIMLAIVVVAPSNYIRLNTSPEITKVHSLGEFLVGIPKALMMLTYLWSFNIPYYAILALLAYYIGTTSTYNLSIPKNKVIWISLLILAIYACIMVLPFAYLFGGIGEQRNYTPLVYFSMIVISMIFYILGQGHKEHFTKVGILSKIGIGIIGIIMCINIHVDTPIAQRYAKAHDERRAYLLQLQKTGNKKTIVVEPYPSTLAPCIKYNILRLFGKKKNEMSPLFYEADTYYISRKYSYEREVCNYLGLDFSFIIPAPQINE